MLLNSSINFKYINIKHKRDVSQKTNAKDWNSSNEELMKIEAITLLDLCASLPDDKQIKNVID